MVLKLSILHKQETIDASLVAPLMDGNSVYAEKRQKKVSIAVSNQIWKLQSILVFSLNIY